MNIENHLKAFEEHKKAIFEWALGVEGLENSQRIVGTHAARGITELLSAFLHKLNKVDLGFQVNHRWFKSERVFGKIPDFPKKKRILSAMIELENLSESLTYGTQKPVNEIEKVIKLFEKLEKEIAGLMKNEK